MEAMRTALTLANHPRAGAPPPPQFCDAQISVRDLHRAVSQADARKEAYDVKQPFNQPPIYPHYQLDAEHVSARAGALQRHCTSLTL